MLIVIRGGNGEPSARASESFTGDVWRDRILPPTDGVTIGNNFFAPCARTFWHSHEGGQILIVLAGDGFVADADGPLRVSAGDTIWTPPGVLHWHGASATRYLVHTAITLGGTNWHDAVSAEDYPS